MGRGKLNHERRPHVAGDSGQVVVEVEDSPSGQFGLVPNVLVLANFLSPTARLAAIWLVGRPPGWKTRPAVVQALFGWSETTWRRVARELMACGLLLRSRTRFRQGTRDEEGNDLGGLIAWHYKFRWPPDALADREKFHPPNFQGWNSGGPKQTNKPKKNTPPQEASNGC